MLAFLFLTSNIQMKGISKIAEWLQPILGTTAGFLIALNVGDIWVITAIWLFLCKDVALMVFSVLESHKGLLFSGVCSAALNIFGIIRWTFY